MAKLDEVEWSLTHAFFANMGGFVVRYSDNYDAYLRTAWYGDSVTSTHNLHDERRFQEDVSRGLLSDNIHDLEPNVVKILDAKQLLNAREKGIISRLPNISKAKLQYLSRTDHLAQLLAVGQVIWLIFDLIMRWFKHLPSSLLEILVLSQAVPALFIFIFQWYKPKDVRTREYIFTNRHFDRETFTENEGRPGDDFLERLNDLKIIVLITVLLVCTQTINLFAWNFDFPTPTERLLWRIAALAYPVLFWGSFDSYLIFDKLAAAAHRPRVYDRRGPLLLAVTGLLSKLFIIIEALQALFFLPPEAFLTTWASSLPQVS